MKAHLVENDIEVNFVNCMKGKYECYRTSSTHIANPNIFTACMTGTEVTMGIDTGASVSLISEKQWARIKESVPQLTMSITMFHV